jgi:hypothetical protein
MLRFYSGIGARATPPEVLSLMTRAAFALLKRGYVLRSGHAIGADSAFERGAGRDAQIFLPARAGAARRASSSRGARAPSSGAGRATSPPRTIPPSPGSRLRPGLAHPQRLPGARASLDSPSEFVLCWTADGEASGGTGQALRIAATHGVPVYNLQRARERAHVERHLVL